ncbi:hypothetical protein [Sabulicella glaciei]|uniref:Uncharacterized protein n=1 Tax=Sabulicella glaciei TaxID=2984948 RepID=A0ABT3NV67_9PROT|nr:hypothetical protein [Roseococcus sp. MDT2-1-1]MCW8086053.1 hypothetical protein [Roseococcus sp. MDT2-1-1]
MRFDLPLPCEGCALRRNRIEVGVNATQFFGGQTNADIGVFLRLRTGEVPLVSSLAVNLAIGIGVSHAFDRPELEDWGNRGKNRRTQIQVPMEFEWSHAALRERSVLAPRIHHRSGAWGLVAPQGVGSNFIGVGLRRSF